jgi:hypothetical protein
MKHRVTIGQRVRTFIVCAATESSAGFPRVNPYSWCRPARPAARRIAGQPVGNWLATGQEAALSGAPGMADPIEHIRRSLVDRIRRIIDNHRPDGVGLDLDAKLTCSCGAEGPSDPQARR